MTKSVANVVLATDTFENWLTKTNILLDALSTEIITVTANSTGAVTVGNGQVNGSLRVSDLIATDALRGGTVDASNTLTVTSNAVFSNVSIFNSNVSVNSVANLHLRATQTTLLGGAVRVSSNLTVNTSGTTQINSSSFNVSATNIDLSGTIGDIDVGVVNATAITGIGTGFSTINVFTTNTTFTVPDNVYKLKFFVTGGGGGGGGAAKYKNDRYYHGGGGGAGGTSIGTVDVTPGEGITLTIGDGGTAGQGNSATAGGNAVVNATAGGTTSMAFGNGSSVTATGGSFGRDGNNKQQLGGNTAAGGVGSGGLINLTGQGGGAGAVTWQQWQYGADRSGGTSYWGPGPTAESSFATNQDAGGTGDGANGVNFGTGGAGGGGYSGSSNGGIGAPGVVVIEY